MVARVDRLVLLRHGETEWSRDGRHTGLTDIPLTPLGERQAAAAAPALARLELRNPLVVTSPRRRAIRTAELAGLEPDRTWGDLSEWDYGEYEGMTTPEIVEHVPNWTVFTHPCPGGETAEQVQSRADLVLSSIAPTLADRDVVLVGHGHFSRCLIARWAQFAVVEGRRFAMAAGAYSVLGYEHGAAQIVHHNIASELS